MDIEYDGDVSRDLTKVPSKYSDYACRFRVGGSSVL